MVKKGLAILFVVSAFALIITIFWMEEEKYSKVTEKPIDYKEIPLNSIVSNSLLVENGKPTLIHFFNPLCVCSKFNYQHFEFLTKKYEKEVNFIVALHLKQGEVFDQDEFQNDIGQSIIVVDDSSEELAKQLGVYSTPQAVIIDTSQSIYYRGNYNRARFCTSKNTNFVLLSLQAVINGQELPHFDNTAIQPYGCELPANEI